MFKKIFLVLALVVIFQNVEAKDFADMNIDDKIGQMMCLDFRFWKDKNGEVKPVTCINEEIKSIIKNYHIGNIILFSQNFQNKNQAKKLISDLQSAAMEYENVPLLIYTDQEGGTVERFAFGREKLTDNLDIGRKFGAKRLAYSKGCTIGKELYELGVNCDLAPVVDINTNPRNTVINKRSFGITPEIVSGCAVEFMKGLHKNNVFATAKHFPGHGDTRADSHIELPRVYKNLSQIESQELKPFKSMINSGVDCIMAAHIEMPFVDSNTLTSEKDRKRFFVPASLSRVMLTDILRDKLNFKGIIITDAMNMKAISENMNEAKAVLMAIQAGADIICMPTTIGSMEDAKKLDTIFLTIKEYLSKNPEFVVDVNNSVKRILNLKSRLKF